MSRSNVVGAFRVCLRNLNSTRHYRERISALTVIARNFIVFAPDLVEVIENRLRYAPSNIKIYLFYLIDSIVKNVGGRYVPLFSRNIVKIFLKVYRTLERRIRLEVYKLRDKWCGHFPAGKLHELDIKLNQIDPMWPIAPAPSKRKKPLSLKGWDVSEEVSVPSQRTSNLPNRGIVLGENSCASNKQLLTSESPSNPFKKDVITKKTNVSQTDCRRSMAPVPSVHLNPLFLVPLDESREVPSQRPSNVSNQKFVISKICPSHGRLTISQWPPKSHGTTKQTQDVRSREKSPPKWLNRAVGMLKGVAEELWRVREGNVEFRIDATKAEQLEQMLTVKNASSESSASSQHDMEPPEAAKRANNHIIVSMELTSETSLQPEGPKGQVAEALHTLPSPSRMLRSTPRAFQSSSDLPGRMKSSANLKRSSSEIAPGYSKLMKPQQQLPSDKYKTFSGMPAPSTKPIKQREFIAIPVTKVPFEPFFGLASDSDVKTADPGSVEQSYCSGGEDVSKKNGEEKPEDEDDEILEWEEIEQRIDQLDISDEQIELGIGLYDDLFDEEKDCEGQGKENLEVGKVIKGQIQDMEADLSKVKQEKVEVSVDAPILQPLIPSSIDGNPILGDPPSLRPQRIMINIPSAIIKPRRKVPVQIFDPSEPLPPGCFTPQRVKRACLKALNSRKYLLWDLFELNIAAVFLDSENCLKKETLDVSYRLLYSVIGT